MPLLGAASCIFLMYYLAADTWWRFIGWLVLGLSVYLAYGYTRSAIGVKMGRPEFTPLPLKIAALGFFALAVGLFTVPHHIGFTGVFQAAADSANEYHNRSLFGVSFILIGLVLGVAGGAMTKASMNNAEPNG
jgi:APA family basic amino acid/polyamine antiporter